MKSALLRYLLNEVRHRPDLKRKLKIFAVVAGFGVIVLGALSVWAAIATFNMASGYAASLLNPAVVERTVESARTAVQDAAQISPARCWEKTLSMLNAATWLEVPLATNVRGLKQACFEQKSTPPTQQDNHYGGAA